MTWTTREKWLAGGLAVVGIGAGVMAYLMWQPKTIVVTTRYPAEVASVQSSNYAGNEIQGVNAAFSPLPTPAGSPPSNIQTRQMTTKLAFPLVANGKIAINIDMGQVLT